MPTRCACAPRFKGPVHTRGSAVIIMDRYLFGVAFVYMLSFTSLYVQIPGKNVEQDTYVPIVSKLVTGDLFQFFHV